MMATADPTAKEQARQQAETSNATPSSNSSKWICRTERAGTDEKPSGALDKQLTVGEKFILVCEGDPTSLERESLSLRLPKEQKYSLRLLRVQELGESGGTFTATTYKVGAYDVTDAILSDGTNAVALDGVRLNVASVINPQEKPEMKAFAPWGPVALAWPTWMWISLVILSGVLLGWLVRVFVGSWRRKRFLAELERNAPTLSPYNQFNKELRALGREFPLSQPQAWNPEIAGSYIEKLNQSFRWYLSREFVLPAFRWSRKAIDHEVKRKNRGLYTTIEGDLRLALRELERGSESRVRLSALDAQQLLELCRKVADDVFRARQEAKR